MTSPYLHRPLRTEFQARAEIRAREILDFWSALPYNRVWSGRNGRKLTEDWTVANTFTHATPCTLDDAGIALAEPVERMRAAAPALLAAGQQAIDVIDYLLWDMRRGDLTREKHQAAVIALEAVRRDLNLAQAKAMGE